MPIPTFEPGSAPPRQLVNYDHSTGRNLSEEQKGTTTSVFALSNFGAVIVPSVKTGLNFEAEDYILADDPSTLAYLTDSATAWNASTFNPAKVIADTGLQASASGVASSDLAASFQLSDEAAAELLAGCTVTLVYALAITGVHAATLAEIELGFYNSADALVFYSFTHSLSAAANAISLSDDTADTTASVAEYTTVLTFAEDGIAADVNGDSLTGTDPVDFSTVDKIFIAINANSNLLANTATVTLKSITFT